MLFILLRLLDNITLINYNYFCEGRAAPFFYHLPIGKTGRAYRYTYRQKIAKNGIFFERTCQK